MTRTQVGIVGAGPAGLLLSRLLHLQGIESVILEARSRAHVEGRIRAGVLEQVAVETLIEAGFGERLRREGLIHRGIEISFAGRRHRIDFEDLTGGRTITVYGQHEVVKDMIASRLAEGGQIHFEAEDVSVHDIDGSKPRIRYRQDGAERELACDFIAGCDGFHGVCRPSIPAGVLTAYERTYPFAWLGILAQAPTTSEELVYSRHDDGFALYSMRSPEVTRLYLQCALDDDFAHLARRTNLGGAASAARNRRRLAGGRGPGRGAFDRALAQFRGRTDALWTAVPGRRRRPHRTTDRRQGHEPGDRRRAPARPGAGCFLRIRP